MKDKTMRWVVLGALLLSLGVGGLASPGPAWAATFVVNTTNDIDDGTCNSAHCSLREGINAANANPGADTISFNIPGAGPHTISPATGLPVLTGSGTVLNGYSQPGAVPPDSGTPAVLKIEIDGSVMGDTCLRIVGTQITIRGLAINRCQGDGIWIYQSGGYPGSSNVVAGNHIGTNVAGTADLGCWDSGVRIDSGAGNNTVGGTAAADRNVISGNDGYLRAGVLLAHDGTQGNTVAGNYIGTDAHGTADLGNGSHGVAITRGAKGNTVKQNVISGNDSHGVLLFDPGTDGNLVWGNLIGTDKSGTGALGNGYDGIMIGYQAAHNVVGGDTTGKRNVISGNGRYGLLINAGHNTVIGNYIGPDTSGAAALGNVEDGLYLDGGHDSVIGGTTAGARNVISGNGQNGIVVEDATAIGNVIKGNHIGTNAAGTEALGNGRCGVQLRQGAAGNTLGPGNVLSANGWQGIFATNAGTGNTIAGNRIGTNAAGTAGLENGTEGILVDGTVDLTVGPGNLIAFHGTSGVRVDGSGAYDIAITRNSIHSNGWGIRLTNGGNQDMAAPAITGVTVDANGYHVSGTACAGCTVELFANPDGDGEGKTYAGQAVAGGGGAFVVDVGQPVGYFFTATATDNAKGTSEFSAAFEGPARHWIYLPVVRRSLSGG
jgi:CSLREA domain-containing protein